MPLGGADREADGEQTECNGNYAPSVHGNSVLRGWKDRETEEDEK